MSKLNTPRDFAMIRHLWRLPKEYVAELDIYMLLQTSVSKFLDKYDEVLPWVEGGKDRIKIRNAIYECEFINCGGNSLADLEENGEGERPILLSLRANFEKKLYVVLISIPDEGYINTTIPTME